MIYPPAHDNAPEAGEAEVVSVGTRMRRLRAATGLSQIAFAERLGINQSTVSKWETGVQEPMLDHVQRLAAVLDRDLETLLADLGLNRLEEPAPALTVPIIGGLSQGTMVQFYPKDRSRDGLSMPRWGNPLLVALDIANDSLGSAFRGWVAYYSDDHKAPTKDLYGQLCVLGMADGKILVKVVEAGRKPGHYDLHSPTERVQQDQRVVWAARILGMAPYPGRR
jgi:DNA-binding XRE family transcriptional regulator